MGSREFTRRVVPMNRLWPGALEHLRACDPVMARIIDQVGDYPFEPDTSTSHFEDVMEAIVFQQLSGKAARTIYSRVKALYGGRPPSPHQLLETSDESLRAAGLSGQKSRYLKDLANHAISGDVAFESLDELDDQVVIEQLTKVKGVGVWTAHMFLMFRLGRPDILPDLDLGIRKAIQVHYGVDALPTVPQVQEIGAPWHPYATPACLYLWRSLDVVVPGGTPES